MAVQPFTKPSATELEVCKPFRREKVNRVQRGRLGGLKAAATKAADTGRYKDPLLETCRSCKERKILVVNGVCISCREKAQKEAN
jgi:hypothetical protein